MKKHDIQDPSTFTGMERVAARIGDGGLDVGFYLSNTDSLHARANRLFGQSLAQVNGRVLEANDVDCIMNGEMPVEELGIPIEAISEQISATVGTEYGEFLGAMHLVSNAGESPEVYFYHSDHLGSASWITDSGGQAIQHLQYLPYGKPYINQRTSGYNERYTFTGKERDEETGYGYFGARYMDHELMTMWLSVDPLADKYPGISPYAYCAWNPVKLVDPDGMENVIYLVNLQTQQDIDITKVIERANKVLEGMGLATRVCLAPNGKDFNPEYMDPTDSYVVIGNPNDVKKFISKNSPQYCEEFGDWYGGYNNPERSSNEYHKKSGLIALSSSGTIGCAKELNKDNIDMAVYLILHGAGHNAGLNDNEGHRRFNQNSNNCAIMNGGGFLDYLKRIDFSLLFTKECNSTYIDRMKSTFGNKESQNNYERNQYIDKTTICGRSFFPKFTR